MKPQFEKLSRDSSAILTEHRLKAAGYLMSREQAERVFNGTTAETVRQWIAEPWQAQAQAIPGTS